MPSNGLDAGFLPVRQELTERAALRDGKVRPDLTDEERADPSGPTTPSAGSKPKSGPKLRSLLIGGAALVVVFATVGIIATTRGEDEAVSGPDQVDGAETESTGTQSGDGSPDAVDTGGDAASDPDSQAATTGLRVEGFEFSVDNLGAGGVGGLAGVAFTVTGPTGDVVHEGRTGAQQSELLALAPGTYTVGITAPDGYILPTGGPSAEATFDVGAGPLELVFTASRPDVLEAGAGDLARGQLERIPPIAVRADDPPVGVDALLAQFDQLSDRERCTLDWSQSIAGARGSFRDYIVAEPDLASTFFDDLDTMETLFGRLC